VEGENVKMEALSLDMSALSEQVLFLKTRCRSGSHSESTFASLQADLRDVDELSTNATLLATKSTIISSSYEPEDEEGKLSTLKANLDHIDALRLVKQKLEEVTIKFETLKAEASRSESPATLLENRVQSILTTDVSQLSDIRIAEREARKLSELKLLEFNTRPSMATNAAHQEALEKYRVQLLSKKVKLAYIKEQLEGSLSELLDMLSISKSSSSSSSSSSASTEEDDAEASIEDDFGGGGDNGGELESSGERRASHKRIQQIREILYRIKQEGENGNAKLEYLEMEMEASEQRAQRGFAHVRIEEEEEAEEEEEDGACFREVEACSAITDAEREVLEVKAAEAQLRDAKLAAEAAAAEKALYEQDGFDLERRAAADAAWKRSLDLLTAAEMSLQRLKVARANNALSKALIDREGAATEEELDAIREAIALSKEASLDKGIIANAQDKLVIRRRSSGGGSSSPLIKYV